jgi:hypothetical protein
MRQALRGWTGILCLLVCAAACERRKPSSDRLALSPQSCNTECQTRQTDCILECDGRVPCEAECTRRGEACVARCRQREQDAGKTPPGTPPR